MHEKSNENPVVNKLISKYNQEKKKSSKGIALCGWVDNVIGRKHEIKIAVLGVSPFPALLLQ